jgi:hypothetical protein
MIKYDLIKIATNNYVQDILEELTAISPTYRIYFKDEKWYKADINSFIFFFIFKIYFLLPFTNKYKIRFKQNTITIINNKIILLPVDCFEYNNHKSILNPLYFFNLEKIKNVMLKKEKKFIQNIPINNIC